MGPARPINLMLYIMDGGMKVVYHCENIIPLTGIGKHYQYMAVDGDKIIYAGNHLPREISHLPQIDFGGKTILPGFFDTHTHFTSLGFCVDSLPLFKAESMAELLENLSSHVRQRPQNNYFLFGHSPHKLKERRLLTRQELDRIESRRPLFIGVLDGHGGVGNSAVVNKTQLKNRAGFDPEKGHYFQDSFYEIFRNLSRQVSVLNFLGGLPKAAAHAVKQGVTTLVALQGEGIPLNLDLKAVRIYAKFAPIRIVPYFQTRSIVHLRLSGLRNWGGCFDCAIDGVPSSFDMALQEPYTVPTDIPGNKGKLFYPPQELDPMIRYAEKHGIQLAIHAIGDRAVAEVVNAFARNIRPGNPNRHRIEHAVLLDDDLIEKISRWNLHICTQPGILSGDVDPIWFYEKILGQARTWKNFMPLQKMLQAGIEISGSSDAPVTLVNPLHGIHAAVNHFNPEHSVPVYEALKFYTINGAKAVKMEDRLGTIATGKTADFVVLDKNPLTIDNTRIKDIQVLAVFKDGKQMV